MSIEIRDRIKNNISNTPVICADGKRQLYNLISELLEQGTGKGLNYVEPIKPIVVVRGQVYTRAKQLFIVTSLHSSNYSSDYKLVDPFRGIQAENVRFVDNMVVSALESQGYQYAAANFESLAAEIKKS